MQGGNSIPGHAVNGPRRSITTVFRGKSTIGSIREAEPCALQEPANAKIVAKVLRHLAVAQYELASFVVMPNHMHVLSRPLGAHALPEIIRAWKGFTAGEINRRIGKAGPLWRDEDWNRFIRSETHFRRVVKYIQENPVKA